MFILNYLYVSVPGSKPKMCAQNFIQHQFTQKIVMIWIWMKCSGQIILEVSLTNSALDG